MFKVYDGAICKVDTVLKLTSQQEWWEEYCLNFAVDAGAIHSTQGVSTLTDYACFRTGGAADSRVGEDDIDHEGYCHDDGVGDDDADVDDDVDDDDYDDVWRRKCFQRAMVDKIYSPSDNGNGMHDFMAIDDHKEKCLLA